MLLRTFNTEAITALSPEYQKTLLFRAIKMGCCPEAFSAILENSKALTPNDLSDALFAASEESNSSRYIDALLEMPGIDANAPHVKWNNFDRTPLVESAERYRLENVLALLRHPKIDVNLESVPGQHYTPAIAAEESYRKYATAADQDQVWYAQRALEILQAITNHPLFDPAAHKDHRIGFDEFQLVRKAELAEESELRRQEELMLENVQSDLGIRAFMI